MPPKPFLPFKLVPSLIAIKRPVANNKMTSYITTAASVAIRNPGTTLAAGVGGVGLLAVAAPAAIAVPLLGAAGFGAGGVGAGR